MEKDNSQSAPVQKIVVRLRATGSAPILRQSVFKIAGTQKLQTVAAFLRKELGHGPDEQLFLYVNSSFAPAPDETIENLYRCFGNNGNLLVNYAMTAAWG